MNYPETISLPPRPIKDMLLEAISYFGALQCNVHSGTPEAIELARRQVDMLGDSLNMVWSWYGLDDTRRQRLTPEEKKRIGMPES